MLLKKIEKDILKILKLYLNGTGYHMILKKNDALECFCIVKESEYERTHNRPFEYGVLRFNRSTVVGNLFVVYKRVINSIIQTYSTFYYLDDFNIPIDIRIGMNFKAKYDLEICNRMNE